MSLFLTTACQAKTYVFISLSADKQLLLARLEAGKLHEIKRYPLEGAPGAITFDPKHQVGFVSIRSNDTISSFRFDATTEKLTPINSVTLEKGANATHLATDHTGKWLISASYSGGTVVVHGINEGKLISPASDSHKTARTAHFVHVSADNRFVMVPHVGTNSVHLFQFDALKGKLTPTGMGAGGKEKAGPRHLAFLPNHPDVAFTSDEIGNSITRYDVKADEKGILKMTPKETLSTLPADFTGKNTTAEVKVHPNGKFVWVSNRGHDSLAGFAISPTGLKSIGQTPTEKTPRSFAITPDGKYLLSGGEGNGKMAIYSINSTSGELKKLESIGMGKSISWIAIGDWPDQK
ncbi:MAG: beta-propeller fold lactonase family protein [Zavarzinella sp.]